jgi:uncharacterized membrane protein (UPF0182 family)
MFTSASQMPTTLRQHLRYPEDIFSVQAALYGRYHLSSSNAFYNADGAWTVSPSAGAGSSSQALQVTLTTNPQGQTITGSVAPMAPIYQVFQLPGTNTQSFTISDAYVPFTTGTTSQNLAAFMVGTYKAGAGGKLHVYLSPGGQQVGPALAESEIQQNSTVSQDITLLDQHGSTVLLGNILMVPVANSVIYIRPLYVESSGNPQPELTYVISVLGQDVEIQPTVQQSLEKLLQVPVVGPGGTVTSPSSVSSATTQAANQYLQQAQSYYNQAQNALQNGGSSALSQYQADIDAMANALNQAEALLNPTGNKTSTPSSTTTTTTPRQRPKSKTTAALGGPPSGTSS